MSRALRHRHPGADARVANVVSFDEHRAIPDDAVGRLSGARSIFVYTHALELFRRHVWARLSGAGYVLITHNSDAPVGPEEIAWMEAAGPKLQRWFAANLLVEHPRITPLPLGAANAHWAHGDLEALSAVAAEARRKRPTELLHARFDDETHPDRRRLAAALEAAGFRARAGRLPYVDYLRELARHRFCVCPRGNGPDTHRFWECHYLGVVPVVERSRHTELWAGRGLPMVALENWSQLSAELLEAHRGGPAKALSPTLRLSHYAHMLAACRTSATGSAAPR